MRSRKEIEEEYKKYTFLEQVEGLKIELLLDIRELLRKQAGK